MWSFARFFVVACLGAIAVFWAVTRPAQLDEGWADPPTGNAEAGALVFAAAGCASCHTSPDVKTSDGAPILTGGRAFETEFGTFYAPNISADPSVGIGDWTFAEFARALTLGVSPAGKHYYPAFPYTSYAKMDTGDVSDLFAYMKTLPVTPEPNKAHAVTFPFSQRRAVGVWKRLYMTDAYHLENASTPELERGRYLVETLAHCAECHTPRMALGGLDHVRWMEGAPDPAGTGRIPAITPQKLDWSTANLVAYFTSGLTPDYDSAGGDMVVVIENLAKLPEADRMAIAAYLGAL